MATTYLTRTFASGNRKTWTYSVWCKRGSLTSSSNGHSLFDITGGSDTYTQLNFLISDSGGSGSATHSLACHTYGGDVFRTTRLLRDTSAWYHIVLAVDTTQATATDRIKLYVNGELQTYSQETNFPGQDEDLGINRNAVHTIGSQGTVANYYFDGAMSHIHFCDGTQYAASDFGSVDATSGEWKMNTSPSVTYGTNGFFILKNGNSVTDQSGEGNNWTVGGGTLTNLEDCPDNVFCTLNPLESRTSSGTAYPAGFSNVNNTTNFYTDNATTKGVIATFAPSAGKYYWELKVVLSGPEVEIGVAQGNYTGTNYGGNPAKFNFWQYQEDGRKGLNRGSWASYGNSWTTGDFLSFALDCGTGTIWAAKNGTWQNSATTAEISAGTTTNAMFTGMDNTWGFLPAQVLYDANGSNITLAYNFGNGCFEATQLSGTTYKGSGDIGIFKYNIIPTGYTALSTKGLQE